MFEDQMSMEPKRDRGVRTERTVGGRLLASWLVVLSLE